MSIINFSGSARPLSSDDIRAAARRLNVGTASIKAVLTVETGGAGGFLSDGSGRPRILFEAHVFSRLTQGKYNGTHPNISSPSWNRNLYIGGAGEYQRIGMAVTLNRRAALQSASWGLFQVMGQNFGLAGWPDVEAFVTGMTESEANHLQAFLGFCSATGCADELQRGDWAGFARIYNGPSYAENRYPERLAAAYARAVAEENGVVLPQDAGLLRIGMSGARVRKLQLALNDRGERLLTDGIFGRGTELAVERFQAIKRLVVDGIAGPSTLTALGVN